MNSIGYHLKGRKCYLPILIMDFRPLGDAENLIRVDVRIIAATTEDP